MSQPVIFQGDFSVTAPVDSSAGTGAIKCVDYLAIGSTADTSVSAAPGNVAFFSPGGGYVAKSFIVNQTSTVNGASFLQQTDITTANGAFNVHGSGAATITSTANPITLTTSGLYAILLNSGKNITLNATTGNISSTASAGTITQSAFSGISQTVTNPGDITLLTTNGKCVLTGTNNLASAISLTTSGTASGITLSAGTTGISGSSTGPILLSAANALSSFTLATTAAGQDLAFTLSGATTSRIVSTSSGTGVDAVRHNATAGGITQLAVTNLTQTVSAGGFVVSSTGASSSITQNATAAGQNFTIASTGTFNTVFGISAAGTSASALNVTVPAGGYTSTNLLGHTLTSTSGPFAITSTGGVTGSTISAQSTTNAMDFTISLLDNGTHLSRLMLTSQGAGTDAIRITASTGGIIQSSVSGWASTVTAGSTNFISTTPVASTSGNSFLQYATAASQDFNIGLLGAAAGPSTSRLILTSAGTSIDALKLSTTAGGMVASATGPIAVDSLNTTSGITIGTANPNIPVTIGKTGNTVTVNSNIVFTGAFTIQASGGATGVEVTETLTQDRATVINSNPVLIGDVAYMLQRFQSPTGLSDDILSDTPTLTGTASAAGSTTTIVLASNASAVNGYYIGYWILITNGTAKNSISKITAYTGSSKTATVTIPFSAATDTTSVYALYGNGYGALVLRSAAKRFELVYCPVDFEVYGTVLQQSAYAPLYLQSLTTVPGAGGFVSTDFIYGSTSTSINVSGVTINNGAMSGVTTINGTLVPQTVYVSLSVSNGVGSTAIITPMTASAIGSYIIIVNNDTTTNASGPTGIWMASKSQASRNGTVQQMNQQAGTTSLLGDRVTVTWNANSSATLAYTPLYVPTTNGTYKFIVEIMGAQSIAQ